MRNVNFFEDHPVEIEKRGVQDVTDGQPNALIRLRARHARVAGRERLADRPL